MSLCRVPSQLVRGRWLVTGQVQGVGFRPFVYRIAKQLELSGSVRNGPDGVVIECQGEAACLEQFHTQLIENRPALASIRDIQRQNIPTLPSERDFSIIPSAPRRADDALVADVTVDTATCPACVSEILSRSDRRQGYGLTNCTDCGPRFSIVQRVPYDRCNTTMSHFEMCPSCRAEYANPADRRFHAQPIACHECGPKVTLVDPRGERLGDDPIQLARQMLCDGKILAIKGLGGFHLAVRADDDAAVRRLRQLKKRDHKPFALMVRSIEAARELVDLSSRAAALMQSPACPIVLARRREGAQVAPGVAPANHRLGVMLPYTPIHHLLFGVASKQKAVGREESDDLPTAYRLPPTALVMTSGNQSDEPLAIDNRDALQRLGPMCDAILWHDRPIERGVDDSVVIDIGETAPIFLRRARGYVPSAIRLPSLSPSSAVPAEDPMSPSSGTPGEGRGGGLCLGGELKNTVAVVRAGSAILSHHLGDLSHPRAFESFRKTIDDLRQLFGVTPQWIAHDLHPMYVSTVYARKLSAELGVPLIGVQHHHAHAASVMAEHGITQRVLAVVCDGTGYGPDGSIWGGELLAADLRGFERLAHLRPLRLPGGDAAARDTARCGMALLHQALGQDFADHPASQRLVSDPNRRAVLSRMIRDDIACAQSSGAGRVFDGIAALLGLCDHNHFEAQAAMSLEAAAQRWEDQHRSHGRQSVGVFLELTGEAVRQIDFSPLVRELVDRLEQGASTDELAYVFHEQFAQAWASVVIEASGRTGLRTVVLSGGVFCNARLTRRLDELLGAAGLQVLRHRAVPPNDGGLSLGQAAVACARINGGMGFQPMS